MSKSAVLQLALTTYKSDGSLEGEQIAGDDGKFTIAAYDKLVNAELQISSGDGVKLIDFEGLTPQGFILINKGIGLQTIVYKFSDAPSDSGILAPSSVIAIFNADIDKIEISTSNPTPFNYEYYVFG